MHKLQQCWVLLLLLFLPVALAARQTSDKFLQRKYKGNGNNRYRMTTNVEHNGKWQSTIEAICELIEEDSSGIPSEEVWWATKKVYTPKDTAGSYEDLGNTAVYKISLHPLGKLELPPITQPSLTGEITDFHTFFVAISPKLGIGKLHHAGERYKKPDFVQGNFSNGKDILTGQDCLDVTTTLQELNNKEAVIITSFLPPSSNCLQFILPEMQTPVAGDTLNNFQMVKPTTGEKVNVFFGNETFIIRSILRKKDGVLVSATMDNRLTLRLKVNCNKDYSNCQTTIPFTIKRTVHLELMK
ncbi:hypothetical protein HHL16_11815 [Pseudoflavitalea sp. G-6-1-2]|uniref:hypothetical protein n=1 Tax=Pseudoflavitalea sp. G-6-1-2 TaxID=2728841 RepID=UPI00146A91A6|nr:hypothetical protein [Pseudoflavitalea sp. G-6-1-2]NML21566.1 hypothetical protein [Pseudoflavitalea sp. G-6-1-2]